MNILSLKCMNCGAALEVVQDIDHFACSYCGTQQQVQRSGGIVSLRRLEESLEEVKSGTNRAASELALSRLHADIASICAQRDDQIRALEAAEKRSNAIIGWAVIISVAATVVQFGWWSIPVLIALAAIGWRFIPSSSGKAKAVTANAEARIEALKVQIARHQASIDAYDFGSSGNQAAS